MLLTCIKPAVPRVASLADIITSLLCTPTQNHLHSKLLWFGWVCVDNLLVNAPPMLHPPTHHTRPLLLSRRYIPPLMNDSFTPRSQVVVAVVMTHCLSICVCVSLPNNSINITRSNIHILRHHHHRHHQQNFSHPSYCPVDDDDHTCIPPNIEAVFH